MRILHLPDEIILNILDWIQDDQSARECFAKTKKGVFDNLCWKIVRIKMKHRKLMELSEQIRSNILQRSENLDLNDEGRRSDNFNFEDASIPLTVGIKRAYSVVSKRVELVSQLERVHTYIFVDGSQTELTDILQVLSEKTRLKSLTVKEVVLIGGELEEISVIEDLEALKIRYFSKLKIEGLHLQASASLRTVVLEHCSSIEDVSGLDGIYDLTLKCCRNIKDVSCLNNNYRIKIDGCRGISDVSKSFQRSHCINLFSVQLDFLPSFPSATALSLSWIKLQHPITTLTLPNCLKFLELTDMETIEGLGPNNLQKVFISYCKDFKSLDNMANIRTVELQYLNLTSLYGFGSGNKVVRLKGMKSLEDINALKDCLTISITESEKKLLETHNNLQHVKELTLSLNPYIERLFETFLASNLLTPNLEVLAFERIAFYEEEDVSSFYDNFRIVAERYPKVNKFSFNLRDIRVIPSDYMKEMFVIDYSRPRYIVLFRK